MVNRRRRTSSQKALLNRSGSRSPLVRRPRVRHEPDSAKSKVFTGRCDEYRLFHRDETPLYLHEEYVYTSYRVHLNNRLCLSSLFRLHNETFNIWTHVLGLLLFIYLYYHTAVNVKPDPHVTFTYMPPALHFAEQGTAQLASSVNATFEHLIEAREQLAEVVAQQREAMFNATQEKLAAIGETIHHTIGDRGDDLLEQARSFRELVTQYMHLDYKTKLATRFQRFRLFMQGFNEMEVDAILQLSRNSSEDTPVPLPSSEPPRSGRLIAPRWPLFVYLTCSLICFFGSATFHLYGCHSLETYKLTARLDFSGVAMMIAGSSFPWITYFFEPHPFWQKFYLISLTFFGVLIMVASLFERFSSAEWRLARAMIFLSMGLLNVTPIIHCFMLFGLRSLEAVILMTRGPLVILLYVAGVFVFSSRIPERFIPGRCDLFGKSHEIWHSLVVLAAIANYFVAVNIYHMYPLLRAVQS